MNQTAVGASGMALAVLMGAFGAHALRDRLDAYSIGVYEKAVFYHFVHALGLLIVAILARVNAVSQPAASRIGWLLTAGVLLFSGSLYVLAVTGNRVLGAITPFGGAAFIIAWLWLAWESLRAR